MSLLLQGLDVMHMTAQTTVCQDTIVALTPALAAQVPTPSHTEPSPSTGTGNNTDPRYNTEELTLRLILCQNQI